MFLATFMLSLLGSVTPGLVAGLFRFTVLLLLGLIPLIDINIIPYILLLPIFTIVSWSFHTILRGNRDNLLSLIAFITILILSLTMQETLYFYTIKFVVTTLLVYFSINYIALIVLILGNYSISCVLLFVSVISFLSGLDNVMLDTFGWFNPFIRYGFVTYIAYNYYLFIGKPKSVRSIFANVCIFSILFFLVSPVVGGIISLGAFLFLDPLYSTDFFGVDLISNWVGKFHRAYDCYDKWVNDAISNMPTPNGLMGLDLSHLTFDRAHIESYNFHRDMGDFGPRGDGRFGVVRNHLQSLMAGTQNYNVALTTHSVLPMPHPPLLPTNFATTPLYDSVGVPGPVMMELRRLAELEATRHICFAIIAMYCVTKYPHLAI